MRNLNKLSVLFLSFFLPFSAHSQEGSSGKQKKYSIIPMPVIAANPTTGLIYGVAPGVSWVNGDASSTSMSNFLGTFLYTTKSQLFLQLRGNMFLEGDKWISTTDVRYNLNSQPTYGLGTNKKISNETIVPSTHDDDLDNLLHGPKKSEMMEFDHFRLYQTFLKRHEDTRFFYGLGYHLDIMSNIKDNQLDLDNGIETYHYIYQSKNGLPFDKYTQSGISLNATFDSRDNIANPYSGRYLFASFRYNPEFLGSTSNASQLWLEYRDYFNLSSTRPRNLIAFWAFGWFVTSGKVPYMFLPATGWDMFGRSGRPYTMGRFRGKDLAYSEVEWRFPLQKKSERFGGVLFLNTVSATYDNVNLLGYMQFGYGAGLRYMLSPKNRINISVDYGRGENGASGFFLNLNEVF